MSGFKKSGIFPLNPSEVTDRQIAPSKLFQQQSTKSSQDVGSEIPTSTSKDPLFSPDKVALYKKRYEEGYYLEDPGYVAWLKINHPTEVCSIATKSSSDSGKLLLKEKDSSDSGKPKPSSSDAVSEILVFPSPVSRPKSKRKPALNARTVCITDDGVLEELKKRLKRLKLKKKRKQRD